MADNEILSGIRVLDFSRYIAGPYCAAMLGYLGADVIRIEKPGGSEDRYAGPVCDTASSVSLYTGCNKRSITLNLKSAEGQDIVRRLVAGADVVICNLPPPGLKALGLDYETLKAIKTDIILTSQTAYGHEGPWAERGGFDGVAQVMSGAAYFSGTPGKPVRAAVAYVDYATAVLGAFGTLAAIYHRRDTGEGQHVQASLLGSALAAFNPMLIEQGVLGLNRTPTGNRSQTSAPTDIFATSDGFVTTHIVGQGLFSRIAKALGKEAWIDDARFDTDWSRGEHSDEICDQVVTWMAERSTEEVLGLMAQAGVPCAPILTPSEALAHPQVEAMGYFKHMDYPGLAQPAPIADLPLSMSGTTVGIKRRPPTIGEHTAEVLREIGLDDAEIRALQQCGAT